MAVSIPFIERHKRKQPLGPLSINWALPITQSLEFAVIDPATDKPDLVSGIRVNTVTGGWSRNSTEYGEGLYSNAELNRSVSYNVPLLDKPFTLIIGYHIHTIPTAVRTLCGNLIANTSGFRLTPDTANFRAQFARTGAAQTLVGSAIAVGSKIDAVIADATNFYYYENGALSASDTQTGFVAPTDLFKLGGSNTPISTISFCYMFSRALSADEVRQLYEEPYKIIVPNVRLLQISSATDHGLSGDIVGPPAGMTGEVNHYAPGSTAGSFLLSGDIVGPPAQLTGELYHYNPASVDNHGITADIQGGLTGQLSGTLLRSTPYTPPPPPETTQAFGGFWDLPTGRRRSERIKELKQKQSDLIDQELEIELKLEKYPDNINKLGEIQDNKAAILEQILTIQAEQERFKQEFNIKARLLLLN